MSGAFKFPDAGVHVLIDNEDEALFLLALLDDEEYRLQQNHSDKTSSDYPHIERLRGRLNHALTAIRATQGNVDKTDSIWSNL